MIVRFTIDARTDLRSIGDYISRDNPRRARSFVRELRSRAATLSDMPERFPVVRAHAKSGIRRLGHGDYLIFFRVEAGSVQILRILHGARDYEAILFPH